MSRDTSTQMAALTQPSVTGREWSIPFCAVHSPGTRFCTGSAREAATRWGSRRIGRPIYVAWSRCHWLGRALTDPSSRRGTSLREGWCRDPPENSRSPLSGRRSGKIERLSVRQHPVHDHRELAGERHLGLPHAGALGEPHAPALEATALDRLGQDDVGGLVEHPAHPAVAALRYPAGNIALAGLISPARHPEMASDPLRRLEPC